MHLENRSSARQHAAVPCSVFFNLPQRASEVPRKNCSGKNDGNDGNNGNDICRLSRWLSRFRILWILLFCLEFLVPPPPIVSAGFSCFPQPGSFCGLWELAWAGRESSNMSVDNTSCIEDFQVELVDSQMFVYSVSRCHWLRQFLAQEPRNSDNSTGWMG